MFHRKSNVTVFALILIAAIVVACSNGGTTVKNVTAVAMQGDDSGCTPQEIETSQGFLIKVTLKNTGAKEVAFQFPELSYAFTAPPGQTTLGNFTAPTKPGRYDFTCGNSDGSGSPTRGKVRVKEG